MVSIMAENGSLNREELIDQLIEAGRQVVAKGLVVGSGGNLSARVPGRDEFVITGTGTRLHELTHASFATVSLRDELITNSIEPSSESGLHLESYLRRPDIVTCLHLHPQASVLLAAAALPTRFITTDHVYYVRKVVRVPWIRSGTMEIAVAGAEALTDSNIVILENHGCLIVADSVPLALARAMNLEEASEMTMRCHELKIAPKEVPSAYWDYLKENDL